MLWLGIDGGGTKTACSLYTDDLHRIDQLILPTCHYAQAGFEGMERILAQAVLWASERARAASESAQDLGVACAICGYGEGAEASARIEQAVERAADGREHLLVNDVDAAWAAGLHLADGIALIAGTGSIALGVRGERRMRCGGWDYELGDEGSGGWMGRQLLYAFCREADGRAARGAVYDLVRRELGLASDFDVIGFAQRHIADRGRIAALAPLVAQAAQAGDAAAQAIFQQAAQEETALVRAIAERLFCAGAAGAAGGEPEVGSIPVAYIGGTFNAGPLILDPLAAALPECCRLTAPQHEPDLGPVLLLQKRLGRLG